MTNEELVAKFRARLEVAGFHDPDQQAALYLLCNLTMTLIAETVLETVPPEAEARHAFLQRHPNRPDSVGKLLAAFTDFAWDAAVAARERSEGVTVALPVNTRHVREGTVLNKLETIVRGKGYLQVFEPPLDRPYRRE